MRHCRGDLDEGLILERDSIEEKRGSIEGAMAVRRGY
jgi:hypothetical protein